VIVKLVDDPLYFSLHTHSKYSSSDALPSVAEIVDRARQLGQVGLGLTDHGNMAGSIELYTECVKAGIKPFPGSEMYLVRDRSVKKGPEAKRFHLCLVAYTTQGYRNLIKISTDSHRNFYYKPLIDLADLARYAELGWNEGVALTTGCYFGLLTQTLLKEGYDAALQVAAAYASWFDTFIEIQNHGISREEELSEAEVSRALLQIADDLGLPVVLTQDSHYVFESERGTHNTLKHLVAYGTDLDDVVFPGDPYHLVDDEWMRGHHSQEAYERGTLGLSLLLSKHDLRIPEADAYTYLVPPVSASPDLELRQRCVKRLADEKQLFPRYIKRLNEELAVIETSGMASYMLLVASVCDWMRSRGIYYQTRGSAAGSLVCWKLGISNIDPLRWGARFDRFLSKDRTKPPDIDLDVEHDRRREVMDYIDSRYSVAQICTWATLGMNEEDSKGSLKIKYFAKRRAVNKAKGITVKGDDWKSVPPEDKAEIYQLAKKDAFSGYGVHACALVLAPHRSMLEEMVPMQWVASSKTLVTQYDGKTIESIGLIKLDLLGSKTMSVLRLACEFRGVSTDTLLDIPLDDSPVYTMLSRGDTDGCYQMEGGTTSAGCRQLQPGRIGEIIDAMALFRPGVMNSGSTDSYIARKFNREPVPLRHELIARHVNPTRGILLYQDQVISILRDLGMNPDDLTRFLKAVKASNKNTTKALAEINHYLPIIEQMCLKRGMTAEDWSWLQRAFSAFAEYGFNVAHATVYGLTAYRCAYLAYHHPVEFHAALLSVAAGTDKEPKYLRLARRRNVRVKSPDINGSGKSYRVDRNAIRRGFLSVEGIGRQIADALVRGQPYVDWEDFVTKSIGTRITGVKSFVPEQTLPGELIGSVKQLHEVGAFASIGDPPFGEEQHVEVIAV
jgi:DNA polymerase-3 subunit alpha